MWESLCSELSSFSSVFHRHGKNVFLVGGAVRDRLLGQESQDYDFATDAFPEDVRSWFPRVIPTGLQHGTVTVLHRGHSYEVTTFRLDGDYVDHRRPSGVVFTDDLVADLSRRDFTVNAIALDLKTGALIDPFGGQEDLAKRLLRTVGDPVQRFQEDALRILRLYRFSAKLGFEVDVSAQHAVQAVRDRLSSLSRERVRDEFIKAMAGAFPEAAFLPWHAMGIVEQFWPRSLPSGGTDVDWRVIREVHGWSRWSLWFARCTTSALNHWENDLKSLVFSNQEQRLILLPFRALPFLDRDCRQAAKQIIHAWGSRDSIEEFWAILSRIPAVIERPWSSKLGQELLRQRHVHEAIFLHELMITGRDLLAQGHQPGPAVGSALADLQQYVWEHPDQNHRESLMARAQTLL